MIDQSELLEDRLDKQLIKDLKFNFKIRPIDMDSKILDNSNHNPMSFV